MLNFQLSPSDAARLLLLASMRVGVGNGNNQYRQDNTTRGRDREDSWSPNPKDDVHTRFNFQSQAEQYPPKGKPGVSYFKGVIDKKRHVDALLWRDKKGVVRGILNHYPMDFLGFEDKGNINVMVDPEFQRQGIARQLFDEADKRWKINLKQQTYTESGRKFIESILKRPRVLLRSAGDVEGHDFHGNQWTVSTAAQLIPASQRYDFNSLGRRRFLFNPDSGTMVIGAEENVRDPRVEGAHSDALENALTHQTGLKRHDRPYPTKRTDADYDAYAIRGEFMSSNSVQLWATPEPTPSVKSVDAVTKLVSNLLRNGASPKTEIYGDVGMFRRSGNKIKDTWPDLVKKGRMLGDVEGHPFYGNQWGSKGASLGVAPRPFTLRHEQLETEEGARAEFERAITEQYPDGLTVYHESPLENLDSLKKEGLYENSFATIGKPSDYVTAKHKVIVEIKLTPEESKGVSPDMAFTPEQEAPGENRYANLLRKHNGVYGADISINTDQLPPRRLIIRNLGGPGSGNFGHAGRPGEIGGSAPSLELTGIGPDGQPTKYAIWKAKQEAKKSGEPITAKPTTGKPLTKYAIWKAKQEAKKSGRAPETIDLEKLRPTPETKPAKNHDEQVNRSIRDLQYQRLEVLHIINENGKIISEVQGSKHRVPVRGENYRMLKDPSSKLTYVHNHPAESSLSAADLNLAAYPGLKTIHAVTTNGSEFSATVNQPHNIRQASNRLRREAINATGVHAYTREDDFYMVIGHMINQSLHQSGRITYKAKLGPRMQTAMDRSPHVATIKRAFGLK